MDSAQLQAILARGEDSRHQFKRDFTNPYSLAVELTALAKSIDGQILIGVTGNGGLVGLTQQDKQRYRLTALGQAALAASPKGNNT